MRLPIYQIDAFAEAAFAGNPAAVVPLDAWIDDMLLQDIAMENNLSETAYFVAAPSYGAGHYDLRWFTPAAEVDLCGHATLASAHLLFSNLQPDLCELVFHTRSGPLTVTRARPGAYAMDFPALITEAVSDQEVTCAALAAALGPRPVELRRAANLLAVYENAQAIHNIQYSVDLQGALAAADAWGLIATAPADADTEFDFVSRFFAPAKGVPEDPVTGSAHCAMAPYWADRLNKRSLVARQLSQRGGRVDCEVSGDRVALTGACVSFLDGHIEI
jgi:PhzF family phenazine biosynthesis protein